MNKKIRFNCLLKNDYQLLERSDFICFRASKHRFMLLIERLKQIKKGSKVLRL